MSKYLATHNTVGLIVDFQERLMPVMQQGEVVELDANLALGHHRFLVLVGKLNRVFDSDDVARRTGIAMINHRRQRRRFT